MQTQLVTVLVVEDDLVDFQAIERAFEKKRILNPNLMARDGIEALDMLRQVPGKGAIEKPYVILLDLNMPRMGGHEFLKELRADENLKDAVVFVLTTSRDEEDIFKAYELNVAGYMLKSEVGDRFQKVTDLFEIYWQAVVLPRRDT